LFTSEDDTHGAAVVTMLQDSRGDKNCSLTLTSVCEHISKVRCLNFAKLSEAVTCDHGLIFFWQHYDN